MRACELAVHAVELFHVDLAIIRRQAHADEQYRSAAFLTLLDDVGKVATHVIERKAAQTVIAAQFYDENTRVMLRERLPCACEASACGVSTDTGIDDVVRIA